MVPGSAAAALKKVSKAAAVGSWGMQKSAAFSGRARALPELRECAAKALLLLKIVLFY